MTAVYDPGRAFNINIQEVQEELAYYAKRHSLDEVDQMAASLEDERLLSAWEQICRRFE